MACFAEVGRGTHAQYRDFSIGRSNKGRSSESLVETEANGIHSTITSSVDGHGNEQSDGVISADGSSMGSGGLGKVEGRDGRADDMGGIDNKGTKSSGNIISDSEIEDCSFDEIQSSVFFGRNVGNSVLKIRGGRLGGNGRGDEMNSTDNTGNGGKTIIDSDVQNPGFNGGNGRLGGKEGNGTGIRTRSANGEGNSGNIINFNGEGNSGTIINDNSNNSSNGNGADSDNDNVGNSNVESTTNGDHTPANNTSQGDNTTIFNNDGNSGNTNGGNVTGGNGGISIGGGDSDGGDATGGNGGNVTGGNGGNSTGGDSDGGDVTVGNGGNATGGNGGNSTSGDSDGGDATVGNGGNATVGNGGNATGGNGGNSDPDGQGTGNSSGGDQGGTGNSTNDEDSGLASVPQNNNLIPQGFSGFSVSDRDSSIEYSAGWELLVISPHTFHTTSQAGPTVRLAFNGTQIIVVGLLPPGNGSVSASYSIDGGPAQAMSLEPLSGTSSPVGNTTFFSSSVLPFINHTIDIAVTESGQGRNYSIDYLEIVVPSNAGVTVSTSNGARASKVNVSAIVGGIIGALAFILCIALLYWLWERRSTRRKIGSQEPEAVQFDEKDPKDFDINPYVYDSQMHSDVKGIMLSSRSPLQRNRYTGPSIRTSSSSNVAVRTISTPINSETESQTLVWSGTQDMPRLVLPFDRKRMSCGDRNIALDG